MNREAAGYVAEVVIAGMAWAVAARRRYHLPMALGLTAIAGADLARAALAAWWWPGRVGPFVGLGRAVFHGDEALYLVGPAALAWMGVQHFGGRGGAHVIGVTLAALVALVLGYPVPFRGAMLGHAYLVAHLVALGTLLGAIAVWYRRVPGRWMTAADYLLLLYGAADAVLVIGPFAGDPFLEWEAGWLALFEVHLIAVMVQLSMLAARRPGVRITFRS